EGGRGFGGGVERARRAALVDDEDRARAVDVDEDTVDAIGLAGESAEGLGFVAGEEGAAAGEGAGEGGAEEGTCDVAREVVWRVLGGQLREFMGWMGLHIATVAYDFP